MSHIKIDLPELPQSSEVDTFKVVLSPIKSDLCKLGTIIERLVEINNDKGEQMHQSITIIISKLIFQYNFFHLYFCILFQLQPIRSLC